MTDIKSENYNKLITAVKILDDKKAREIKALDLEGITSLADYFVICHGTSALQVKALTDYVIEEMKKVHNMQHRGLEGYDEARWVLIDFGDIIIHIFQEEDRNFYSLERLWTDAKDIPFEVD